MSEEVFVFPSSYAQRRLWFLDQLEPGNVFYNIPFAMPLYALLDIAALERSLNEIAQRHESLRTTFTTVDGQPMQRISAAQRISLPINDLSHLPEEERQTELQRLALEEALRSFDLSRGPLWRSSLVKLGDSEHVLLLTMHHIISDGWSMKILTAELEALYEAYSQGAESPLEELPIQYADYAVWQREYLSGEELERQTSYWKRQLAGAPEVLELPTDKARPKVQTFRGASQWLKISRPVTEQLKELSRREGVTLFMTLLAAFQALLSRYTNQEDIIVGTPVAGRNRVELEPLIGFFVNTLVLRTDLSGDPTFSELVRRVKEVCLGAYAHQDLPFEKLVEELRPERSLSHNPLFQVMFQLLTDSVLPEDDSAQDSEDDASSVEDENPEQDEMYVESGTSISDLGIDFMETAEGLVGRVEYNTDLFEDATVNRMLGHMQTLLKSIAADPKQRLSELSLLTEAERHLLLVEWNSTRKEYPTNKCLHELFESQVERTPEAIAVDYAGEQLSYRELNARANKLAHHLRALGVGPEVTVGICVERSIEALVGIMGILKAGGAYAALDPDYPEQRLAFMLNDTAAPVLLTQQRLIPRLPSHTARVISLDADWHMIAEESSENPVNRAAPKNVATIIYTSGSTGQSKGVALSHLGICNRLIWGQENYQLTVEDRFLHHSSYCFDFSTWELFTTLIAGARLIMARPGGQRDAAYLVRLMAEQRVTIAGFVPSMLNLILEEREVRNCGALRIVCCGGEALPVELQERFNAQLNAELQNTYGPTEASIDVTCWVCRHEDGQRTVPIGRPIANTEIYLLDRKMKPVPIGISGELYIGGASLANGYLNRPSLTAEKFLPNPFSSEPGARLYRTGDLGRYRPDGAIEFLGRIDHQVKIRGFRVEPGEIEATLSQHPMIREAAVLAQGNNSHDKRLVAYLVADRTNTDFHNDLSGELRHFLGEQLPEYMIPSAFVLLDALPLTPNGKLNRSALPEPGEHGNGAEPSYVAPQTESERSVAAIWQAVFGLEQISVHSNFFELGGHSLMMVRVHSKLREVMHKEIPMIDLFRYPTISSLAKSFGEEQRAEPSSQRLHERAEKQRAAANRQKQMMNWRTKANG